MSAVIEKPTAIAKVNTAIVSIKQIEAQIEELGRLYGGTYDVTTADGMKLAKRARMSVREPRLEIERIRIEAKRDLIAVGKGLDQVAASLTEKILAIENPINAQIQAEEKRIEDEKQAKIAAEAKRVADIRARIESFRVMPVKAVNKPSAEIKLMVDGLAGEQITEEAFQEFHAAAVEAHQASLNALNDLYDGRLQYEAEQEELRRQRIENERLQAQEAERQAAERARQAAIDAEEKAVRERIAAAQAEALRKEREEFEATQRAERQRLDKEREELLQRQREQDLRERQAREEAERKEAAAAARRKPKVKKPTRGDIIKIVGFALHLTDEAAEALLVELFAKEASCSS